MIKIKNPDKVITFTADLTELTSPISKSVKEDTLNTSITITTPNAPELSSFKIPDES